MITDVDSSKRIACIKVVRALTSLGLKEAKDAVTNLPATLPPGPPKSTRADPLNQRDEAGAKPERK